MKCKELMVGDWVTSMSGYLVQITNVGEDYAYAASDDDELNPWEFSDSYYQPQPIELTIDLLRANGWEEYNCTLFRNFEKYAYMGDANGNHIGWKNEELSIWLDYEPDDDGVYSDIVVPCKYVHQLQQVLRLAGMTELANNFKVK